MVTQITFRMCKGKHFLNILDLRLRVHLNKRLKQNIVPILVHTCAPISELPSNISTMVTLLAYSMHNW